MNCDDIRRDFAAYLSGELNEADREQLTTHVRECPSCASALEALRNVAEAAKRLGLEPMPCELENSVMASIPRRRHVSLSFLGRRGAWAMAGTVALTCVLAAGLLFVKQPPLTAAQVVARAESNRRGLSTWRQKVKYTIYPQGQKPQVYYTETWAQAPSLLRRETVMPRCKEISISGRYASMVINVKDHFACLSPRTEKDLLYVSRVVSGFSVKERLGRPWSQGKLAGVVQVAGRDCDVVEVNDPKHNTRCQVAIDREAGIDMRTTYFNGDRIESVIETVEFEANQPIPQETFNTDPPKGMPVFKGWSPHPPGPKSRLYGPEYDPSKVTEKLRALPKQQVAGCKAPGTLYAPSYIPAGFRLTEVWWMAADWVPGEPFTDQFVNAVIQYANPETGDTLVITESLKKYKNVGSEVIVGDAAGVISTNKKPYDSLTLTWSKNGLHFQIWASGNDGAEIVRIAKCLQPLAPE